ncbi:hypothetical protein DPEC_G00052260 [Dallia pectoralis]|uniref:Uncharacterized protein n=1 Tax=Dallia pectoralis TaxID=75939 RepID=A0ACC2HCE6_DALPE|nr:hypothetical protein DPEC_G00052260 [Dallia pectoralis]
MGLGRDNQPLSTATRRRPALPILSGDRGETGNHIIKCEKRAEKEDGLSARVPSSGKGPASLLGYLPEGRRVVRDGQASHVLLKWHHVHQSLAERPPAVSMFSEPMTRLTLQRAIDSDHCHIHGRRTAIVI